MRTMLRITGMLLFAFVLGIWGISEHPKALAGDKRSNYYPNITLKTQDDEEVRFYDDLIKGKVVVISLMYADCEICKQGTKNLEQLQKDLGDRLGKEVFIYSISVDPEDTPKKLKAYAKIHEARPGWLFLTGKADDIKTLRLKFGLAGLDPKLLAKLDPKGAKLELKKQNADSAPDPKLHSGMVVINIDALDTRVKARPDQVLQIIQRIGPASGLKK